MPRPSALFAGINPRNCRPSLPPPSLIRPLSRVPVQFVHNLFPRWKNPSRTARELRLGHKSRSAAIPSRARSASSLASRSQRTPGLVRRDPETTRKKDIQLRAFLLYTPRRAPRYMCTCIFLCSVGPIPPPRVSISFQSRRRSRPFVFGEMKFFGLSRGCGCRDERAFYFYTGSRARKVFFASGNSGARSLEFPWWQIYEFEIRNSDAF